MSLPWKNNHTICLTLGKSPITISGNRLLSTFSVMGLSAKTERTLDGSKFEFTIKLERIWVTVTITTFLQTFVLWFLVYLTLFIDVTDFNNRFMGAITGFLVFASLLSPIFESLPKSAEMKLADIWLLFIMIMIILVIIIHVIIEYQQRQGSLIKVSTEIVTYPQTDYPQRKSLRTNNVAKILLPLIIAAFVLIYIFLSTKTGRCAFLDDQTDCD